MNRSRRLVALVALATAIAACSQGTAPSTRSDSPDIGAFETAAPSMTVPSASPTSMPTGTPSVTEPAIDPATVLAVDGIGPYVIGAKLSELQSQALVTNVVPSFNCDDSWEGAEATGRYSAQLFATFHLGRLIDIATSSTELVTPSGARVGMPLTELQNIYGSRATRITGTSGNQALSVRVPDTALGIVFFLDETNSKATAMSAGDVERLEQAVIVGEGC